MNILKKETTPLISIITVTFNAEKFLESTIRSVIAQAYKNIEYIIIDGGSTDNTVEIIKKYQGWIKYWISEPDRGIYDAMNKGWGIANDRSYILFLGAGDRVNELPDLSKYVGCVGVFGNVSLGDNRLFRSAADFRLRLGNTLHHQALLIDKSVHVNPPFDLNYKAYADYDFNVRLYNQRVEFIFDNSFFSYALPGGLTEKIHTEELRSIVRKNFGIFWELLSVMYHTYQNIRYGFK
jgi:glycosyltransferase involved in cell wall biosynthesis